MSSLSKLWGALFFIVGIILFVLALIMVFPLPGYMRTLLALIIFAIVTREALTDWNAFIEKVYVFSIGFAMILFIFLFLSINSRITEVAKPLLLFTVAAIVLAIGSHMLKSNY